MRDSDSECALAGFTLLELAVDLGCFAAGFMLWDVAELLEVAGFNMEPNELRYLERCCIYIREVSFSILYLLVFDHLEI